jgi:hypothetical protein
MMFFSLRTNTVGFVSNPWCRILSIVPQLEIVSIACRGWSFHHDIYLGLLLVSVLTLLFIKLYSPGEWYFPPRKCFLNVK